MASIYVEGLSKEYKEKIRKRELSLKSIDSIFNSIKENYHKRKRVMLIVSIMMILMCLLMYVPVISNILKNQKIDMNFILIFLGMPIGTIIFVLVVCYFLILTRVPKQFHKYLKIGYPELIEQYGYDAIKASPSMTNNKE